MCSIYTLDLYFESITVINEYLTWDHGMRRPATSDCVDLGMGYISGMASPCTPSMTPKQYNALKGHTFFFGDICLRGHMSSWSKHEALR